jgi:hypothetical protein
VSPGDVATYHDDVAETPAEVAAQLILVFHGVASRVAGDVADE